MQTRSKRVAVQPGASSERIDLLVLERFVDPQTIPPVCLARPSICWMDGVDASKRRKSERTTRLLVQSKEVRRVATLMSSEPLRT